MRGFAVKLYTREGNFDIVGNNMPVFFIQDAIKFPDLIHAAKQDPDREFPQAQTAHDNFWDFISLTPESMHMIMWIMSDRAIPRSFRIMEGFGVHTFRLVNAKGQIDVRQVPLEAKAGRCNRWSGTKPSRSMAPTRIFIAAICGTPSQAATSRSGNSGCSFRRPARRQIRFRCAGRHQAHPRRADPVARGRAAWCWTASVDNFFAETEQVAFCTQISCRASTSPTIRCCKAATFPIWTPSSSGWEDPISLTSDQRTQVSIRQFPAGWPHGDDQSQRAGQLRAEFLDNEPGPRESPQKGFQSYAAPEEGPKQRVRSETFADHYSQARQFFVSQTEVEQQHIAMALTFELVRSRPWRSAPGWCRIY